jgi:flagellar hook-basal body complex protein FliE
MNVHGVSGIGTQPVFRPLTEPAGAGKPAAGGGRADFGQLLKGAVGQVDQVQAESAGAVQELLAGSSQDILPVVAAVAKADMSFRLLIGIRNKVIEAYKQTLNMPI